MSAPQDHYLLIWAICHARGEWCPWEPAWSGYAAGIFSGQSYGQFQLLGTPYLTSLDRMGVPVVTKAMREAITGLIEQARLVV